MGKGKGQGVVTRARQQGCVTVRPMALGAVLDRAVIDEVTALADSFADLVLHDLASVASASDLRAGLSGSYLVFLREAVLLAQSCRD